MQLIKDKTVIHHTTFGDGVFKRIEKDTTIVVEFGSAEKTEKKFNYPDAMDSLLKVVDDNQTKIGDDNDMDKVDDSVHTLVHQIYSTNSIVVGENIVLAKELSGKVIFNDSFTVIGDEFASLEIYACYGLNVIGNIKAKKLTVNGRLFVSGDISCDQIICNSSLICNGIITSQDVYISTDAVVDSIHTDKLFCGNNMIVKKTAEIDSDSEIDNSFVACEGVIGAGSFRAKSTVAIEYFDFDGDINGKVVELSTDTTVNEVNGTSHVANFDAVPLFDLLDATKGKVLKVLQDADKFEEYELLDTLSKLAQSELSKITDINFLFDKMSSISYKNRIDNFRDYLFILLAKNKLPKELQQYDTVEGVFSILLPKAESKLEDMEFVPTSIEDIAVAINAITLCKNNLKISYNAAADKIFSSIGLKYVTVSKAIREGRK